MTELENANEVLAAADAVLIGAGAGLSVAGGLNYLDEAAFAQRFPGMLQYGFTNQYQLMGYPFESEALKWGYQSVALDHVYKTGEVEVYRELRKLVGQRDYFVLTSNVDRFFHKNGFDDEFIHTPQGDYERFQCMTPCHRDLWDGRPLVEEMIKNLDRETQTITDPNAVPMCPRCGGPVFMNVRIGANFIEEPYQAGWDAYNQWLEDHQGSRVALLEIGAGFNTPSVIRFPLEAIATQIPAATLVRINPEHAEGPEGTVAISMSADTAISELLAQADATPKDPIQ